MNVIICLFLSLLLACREENENITNNMQRKDTISSEKQYTYLALGDSYTIGQDVEEKDRWSVQLVGLLNSKGIKISSLDIIAQTGWTTAELFTAVEKSNNVKKYDIVSLLIGVNNQYRGQSIETFKNEFRSLLEISKSFADGNSDKVFVLSIPDWSVTPFGKSKEEQTKKEIDAFNNATKKECERAGILYIDITELSRIAKNNSQYIAPDNLHFSGAMYKLWAEKASLHVESLLK